MTKDAGGTVTKRIVYTLGHDQISQTVSEGTDPPVTHTFGADGHGSTRVLTNAVAAIVQHYAYDAYGNALGFDPAAALTSYLYSGESFDSRIDQTYLRTRWYDATTGRFNRLDPFFGNTSDPQSLHKYLYVHGDPVNGVDPSGEFLVSLSIGLGAFAVRTGKEVSKHALATTALYGALGAGAGAYGYWQIGESPWMGAYNGALIGAGLRIAHLQGKDDVNAALKNGTFAALSTFALEAAWGFNFQRVNRQADADIWRTAGLKSVDAFASGVWSSAVGLFDKPAWADSDIGKFLIAGADAAIGSLWSDYNRIPRPDAGTMLQNAASAALINGVQTSFEAIIDVKFDSLREPVRDYIKSEGAEAFARIVAGTFIGLAGKEIGELAKFFND